MREIQACQGSAMLCKEGIIGWIAALHFAFNYYRHSSSYLSIWTHISETTFHN